MVKQIIHNDQIPTFDVPERPKIEYEYIEPQINYKSMVEELAEPSTWEKIWIILKNAPKILHLIYIIITIKENIMTNAKTTITAVVQGLVIILSIFGISIAPEMQAEIVSVGAGLYAIVGMIKGYFTKDKDKDEK